jgi:sulfane dehydrogenase subunit SoxC
VDSGSTWSEAQLEQPVSPHSWRSWAFIWNAKPGTYVLCTRATDTAGNVQPMQQQWNFDGYGNSIQRVPVVVE